VAPLDSNAESALIRRLTSLAPLGDSDVEALGAAARPYTMLARGDHIARPGDAAPQAVIEDGWALRYLPMNDGDHQVIQILLPGDVVVSAAFFQDVRSAAGVNCATDARVRHFDGRQLLPAIADRPALARAFWLGMAVEEYMLYEQIARLGRRSSAEALAHLLLELRHRLERIGDSDGAEFDLPLAQTDVGDLLGITPVHVSRTFSALKRDRLIELDRPRVRFLDIERVAQFCGFDPAYLDPAGWTA